LSVKPQTQSNCNFSDYLTIIVNLLIPQLWVSMEYSDRVYTNAPPHRKACFFIVSYGLAWSKEHRGPVNINAPPHSEAYFSGEGGRVDVRSSHF